MVICCVSIATEKLEYISGEKYCIYGKPKSPFLILACLSYLIPNKFALVTPALCTVIQKGREKKQSANNSDVTNIKHPKKRKTVKNSPPQHHIITFIIPLHPPSIHRSKQPKFMVFSRFDFFLSQNECTHPITCTPPSLGLITDTRPVYILLPPQIVRGAYAQHPRSAQ